MDFIKVLKRAFEITWHYRALWVFGIILALTAGGGGGNAGSQFGGGGDGDLPANIQWPEIPPEVVNVMIAIGIGLACFILALVVASAIARYVSETSLIRMVDDYEETGEKRTVGQGFRLGWSRTAFRLFLIDLLIGAPIVLAFLLLFALSLSPFLLFLVESVAARVIGVIAGIGLFFLVILLAIVVGVVVSVLMVFFRRTCALEQVGVIESIRRGFGLVRRHLGDTALMWLIMFALGVAWTLVLIPVALLLFPLSLLLGGLLALPVGLLVSLVAAEGAAPWIAAAVVGVPVMILVLALPATFLGGLAETFKSTVWTLTYRELRALEDVAGEDEPLLEMEATSSEA